MVLCKQLLLDVWGKSPRSRKSGCKGPGALVWGEFKDSRECVGTSTGLNSWFALCDGGLLESWGQGQYLILLSKCKENRCCF